METYFKYINMFIVLFILSIMTLGSANDDSYYHKDIPCQNLDVLDKVDEIIHWEMLNDTLRIYTRKDSIRDELERWKYIRSLDPEGWE